MNTTWVNFGVNRRAALTLIAVFCLPTLVTAQAYIIGVSSGFTPGTAPLVAINPDTGVYSTLSVSGNSYNALAQDSHGNLYASSFNSTAENGLVSRIDPHTGAPLQTFNAPTPGAGDIRGLGFNQSDVLFAAVNRNDIHGSPTLPDDLYEIDLVSQTTTRIGSMGFNGVQGLDFSPSGLLYSWDVINGLLIVNPVTGAAVDVNSSIGGTGAIQSIVFAPDGRLFGASQQLFSINPLTGAFTAIGVGNGPDIRGIEWVVPEPSTLIISISGVLLFSPRFRRHSRIH
jgi:hypothetical protein